jgi:molybdenum cofactor cytidylyltransferase
VRCIVLAAGASARLGQPKALLEMDGGTLIQHLVERLEAVGLEPVIVTNAEISVDVLLALPNRTIVINPNPDAGRTGSLQCGLKQILDTKGGGRAFRLLVVPVDRPGFSNDTLQTLMGKDVCSCPEKDGRGGHPLLLMPDDVARIRTVDADSPLRDLCTPERFKVDDLHLHLNLDTPEDIEVLRDLAI